MIRLRVCVILILALLLATASVAGAKGNANPGVLPPTSKVQGLTYGEWNAVGIQQLFAIPAPENPLLGNYGPDCTYARVGSVGLFYVGIGPVDVACSVPVGTTLFVGIAGIECSTLEGNGDNEQELRACAQSYVPSELQASIDGVDIQNLNDYLVTSPLFDLTLPEDNILGLPAGTGQSVAHGAGILLTPLGPGQHTIHVYGAYADIGLWYDGTYHVTVTPGH